jgi:hypothetical protein
VAVVLSDPVQGCVTTVRLFSLLARRT